jgi:hypothetical protein
VVTDHNEAIRLTPYSEAAAVAAVDLDTLRAAALAAG